MMRRLLRCRAAQVALLLGAAVLTAHAAGKVAALTVEGVEAQMEANSPAWVLEKHFACQPPGPGYAKVASGDAKWVALGAHLLSFSDACYSENLQSALGQAMRREPRRVLPLVGSTPQLAAEHICLPSISEEQSVALQLREVRRSRQAIEPVQEPEFAAARGACLGFIGEVEKRLWDQLRQWQPAPSAAPAASGAEVPAPAASGAEPPASAASGVAVPAAAASAVPAPLPAASGAAAVPPPAASAAAAPAAASAVPASAGQ